MAWAIASGTTVCDDAEADCKARGEQRAGGGQGRHAGGHGGERRARAAVRAGLHHVFCFGMIQSNGVNAVFNLINPECQDCIGCVGLGVELLGRSIH